MKVRLLRHREIRGSHWMWTGARIHPKKIYGLISDRSRGTSKPVHVVAYEEWVGPVPEGHEIHHRCPVKLCFNPAHLRAVATGPHRVLHNTNDVHCKNGHPRTAENTYHRSDGRRECRDCKRIRDRTTKETQ